MTTLAERREWMREGCPVPAEVRKDDRWPCDYFHLQVRGMYIEAECQGCGQGTGEPGVVIKTGHAPELSVLPAIDRLSLWMVDHAVLGGMDAKAAGEAFDNAVSQSDQVRRWAEAMMMEGHDDAHGGPVVGSVVPRREVGAPRNGRGWAPGTHGVWLDSKKVDD